MTIKLSILIPACDYAEGLQRILSSILCTKNTELEVIISDDSSKDDVRILVDEYLVNFPGILTYRRNYPPLGAVHNWNSLLDMATGEYALLLHHDEYPINNNFVRDTIDLINQHADNVDVFVLDCILVSLDRVTMWPHLSNFIKCFVMKGYPSYIFKRNVLGPASCLLVRRSLYPRFDVRFRWLVDVDLYFQLRTLTARWIFRKDLKICSLQGRKDSITASLKNNLRELDRQERMNLKLKYPNVHIWLSPKNHWVLGLPENILWLGMRCITQLYYILINVYRNDGYAIYKFFTKIKK